jgi:hypothetical protein
LCGSGGSGDVGGGGVGADIDYYAVVWDACCWRCCGVDGIDGGGGIIATAAVVGVGVVVVVVVVVVAAAAAAVVLVGGGVL